MRPIPSILRRTDEGLPAPEQQTSQILDQPVSQPARQPDAKRKPERERVKATFYLEREDIVALDEMQTAAFKEAGRKPERSELVSQAIQLLRRQTSSTADQLP